MTIIKQLGFAEIKLLQRYGSEMPKRYCIEQYLGK